MAWGVSSWILPAPTTPASPGQLCSQHGARPWAEQDDGDASSSLGWGRPSAPPPPPASPLVLLSSLLSPAFAALVSLVLSAGPHPSACLVRPASALFSLQSVATSRRAWLLASFRPQTTDTSPSPKFIHGFPTSSPARKQSQAGSEWSNWSNWRVGGSGFSKSLIARASFAGEGEEPRGVGKAEGRGLSLGLQTSIATELWRRQRRARATCPSATW